MPKTCRSMQRTLWAPVLSGPAIVLLLLSGCAPKINANLPFVPQSQYVNVGGRWLTRDEVKKYKTIRALSNATKVNPSDAMAFNTLGEMFQTDGNFDLAKELYIQALKLDDALSEAHHNLGYIALLEGNPKDAITHLNRALQLSPDDARIYHRLGQSYASLKDSGRALGCYNKALEMDDEYTSAYLDKAKLLYIHRQFQQAEETCRTAQKNLPPVVVEEASEEQGGPGFLSIIMPPPPAKEPPEPVDYQVAYCLALCLKAQGRLNEALTELAAAELSVKGEVDVQLLKARLLQSLNRNAEAIVVLELLREKHPNIADIHKRLIPLYETAGREEDAFHAKLKAADLDHSDRNLQVEAAKAAIAKKDYLRIISVFERLVRLNPKDVPSLRVLADAYDNAGIKRQAALTYQRIVNLSPDDMAARRRLGILYADLPGFQGRAILQFKAVLKKNSRDGEVRRLLGELYLASRNFSEAEKQLRWSLIVKGSDARAHEDLGDLFVKQKRGEEGIGQYKKALEMDPSLLDVRLKLASTLRSLDRRDEALEPLQQYLAERPLDEDARRMYAEILRDLNRREEAVQEYQALAALRPYDTQTTIELAKLTRLLGNLGDAAGMYESLLEKNPANTDALRACGRLYDETDQPLRAMYCWQRLLKLQANDLEAQGRLAAIYKSMGADEEAIAKYETLGKSGDAEAWRNVAYLRLKRKEKALACDAYRSLLNLKQKDIPARLALAGIRKREDSDVAHDEALALYQEAVALPFDPKKPKEVQIHRQARVNLANMLTEANRLADAQDHFQHILQADPAHVPALVGQAVINRKRGRYKDAQKYYLEALKHKPDSVQLHFNLGLLYDYYLQSPVEARNHYQRYIALGGDATLLPQEYQPTKPELPPVPDDAVPASTPPTDAPTPPTELPDATTQKTAAVERVEPKE